MNWDPITRIVGSLGIFTKIDFENKAGRRVLQHFVDLPRLQHLHEGQRSARRALHHQPHLRNLRRQPCHLRLLCAEHGLWGEAAGARRVDRQSRRSRRVHVRPQHLSGQSGRRGLLRADGEGDQSRLMGEGAAQAGAQCRQAWVPHHRRYHDRAESVHRRILSRNP